MNQLDEFFAEVRTQKRTALLPFLTAGDPDVATSVALAEAFALAGRKRNVPVAMEIGFPYSDPIADGPIIQESYNRALAAKTKLDDVFTGFAGLSQRTGMPLVAMISQSLVQRLGAESFVAKAKSAGFSGAIVPDLPVEEAGDLHRAAKAADFHTVHLIAPTTPRDRRIQIAAASTGFVYYVSVKGITGERKDLPADLRAAIADLRAATKLPVCVGFGIGSPEHVAQLKGVADGIIVGSAIVRRLRDVCNDDATSRAQIVEFVDSLLAPLS